MFSSSIVLDKFQLNLALKNGSKTCTANLISDRIDLIHATIPLISWNRFILQNLTVQLATQKNCEISGSHGDGLRHQGDRPDNEGRKHL